MPNSIYSPKVSELITTREETRMLNTPSSPKVSALSLHQAIQARDSHTVKTLLGQGVDLEAKDSRGFTPFLVAAQTGQLELLKDVLAAKANPKATTLDGQTAFHVAAIGGHTAVVQWLWELGLDPLQKDGMGEQVLHHAACNVSKNLILNHSFCLK